MFHNLEFPFHATCKGINAYRKGKILENFNQFEKAREKYQESKKFFEKARFCGQFIQVDYNLAIVLLKLQEREKAIELLKQVAPYSEKAQKELETLGIKFQIKEKKYPFTIFFWQISPFLKIGVGLIILFFLIYYFYN